MNRSCSSATRSLSRFRDRTGYPLHGHARTVALRPPLRRTYSSVRVKTQKIGLIVTDLDGSFWDAQGRAHPDTLAALQAVLTAGMPVLAATARRPASVLATMEENGVLLPCVLFDGSLGRDFTDGVTFHRCVFDSESASSVLEAFVEAGIEPSLNIEHDHDDFVIGDYPSSHPAHLAFNAIRTQRLDLDVAVRTLPVFTFLVIGRERDQLLPVLQKVSHVADSSVTPDLMYGGFSLSVRPKGVSKWSGVLSFCAHRKLDPRRVLAVGDGENDLELLSSAAVACVPTDGCKAALALATYRIPPADLGGWASIVDLIL
jgi:hydroxymethylpyrimidine pyrophosphatase-like HAD family hydrolase